LVSEEVIFLGGTLPLPIRLPQNTPGLSRGNAISILVECCSEQETRDYYAQLSEGGKPDYPLNETCRGAVFGGLTDKFGNHWLLSFSDMLY